MAAAGRAGPQLYDVLALPFGRTRAAVCAAILDWVFVFSRRTADRGLRFRPAGGLDDDAETAPPPTQADIENLLEAAPRYGVEIRVPQQ